jgi:hypothetical protein
MLVLYTYICSTNKHTFVGNLAERKSCVSIVTCRVYCVTYRTGFGLDNWTYCTLYILSSGLQAIQSFRYYTHFPFHCCTRTRILSLH